MDLTLTNMDYQNIYNQIIERAKTRQNTGYVEKHHIIPKCLGGSDTKENLVELTAREHFICHMLLCEIYPSNIDLSYALFLMSINKNKKDQGRYKVSSRTYDRIKTEWNKFSKGRKKPNGFSEKISIALKNRNMDWEARNKKASESLKGRKISWNLKGIPKTFTMKSTYISVSQFDLNGNFIKNYKTIAEASSGNRALHESIRLCIKGKRKTAGGYIWKQTN